MCAGLNEITRLAVAKGANPLTLGGLAGMGDLVLTCTGNFHFYEGCSLTTGWFFLQPRFPCKMHPKGS